jgi:hypothetical protein
MVYGQLDATRIHFGSTLPYSVDGCTNGIFYTTHDGQPACSGRVTSKRLPWGRTLDQIHVEERHQARIVQTPCISKAAPKLRR